MPTANISKKNKATEEFKKSLDKVNADDYARVQLSEKDKDGVWRDEGGKNTSRFFKQDERTIVSIDKDMFGKALDLLLISSQVFQMMDLTGISIETREAIRNLSKKTLDLSDEYSKMKEQIREELLR